MTAAFRLCFNRYVIIIMMCINQNVTFYRLINNGCFDTRTESTSQMIRDKSNGTHHCHQLRQSSKETVFVRITIPSDSPDSYYSTYRQSFYRLSVESRDCEPDDCQPPRISPFKRSIISDWYIIYGLKLYRRSSTVQQTFPR